MGMGARITIIVTLFLFGVSVVHSVTDPNDLAILNQFKKSLHNAELLSWPANDGDACGPPSWPHVFCSGNRVSQIQVKGLGLRGSLPQNFNQLSMLQNLGLQHNEFSGKLPSFSGMRELRYAYLDHNSFDIIPTDFFRGLVNLEVLALDYNPLNASTGWLLPSDLQGSAQLRNLTLMSCNLGGSLPEFLGNMSSLEVLKLSFNRLTGVIPESFRGSLLKILWLNGQSDGMTGPIDIVSSMESLTSLWLHGNKFFGGIPVNIGDLVYLHDFNLNGNDLVGLIPASLANMTLSHLDVNNNHFMGPIPKFRGDNVSYASNPFCLPTPGALCAPDVMALLGFLDGVDYPDRLVSSWSGNDPCRGIWLGVGCDPTGKVITLNLPISNLSGTLSPSIADLDSLAHIFLESNNLYGPIPPEWTRLKSLSLLNLSQNNISLPVPRFSSSVELILYGNSLDGSSTSTLSNGSSLSPTTGSNPDYVEPVYHPTRGKRSTSSKLVAVVAPVGSLALVCLIMPLSVYMCKKKKEKLHAPSLVVHPRDAAANPSASSLTTNGSGSLNSSRSNVIEAGNMVIAVQVLRNVTNNFAAANEVGRGGFGVVYKGELDDGTEIAVKRMEGGVISSKALEEFQSEIAVVSKVRHRNLVSLLGYSVEGNERILVYEYMPQGPLSKHLFQWKELQLEPLSWKRRLNIALDVGRGMEYLHTLAHRSFIHRDLKSSNILLGDDFRAKVSDFGLIKAAPDGEESVMTQLAGTFGYLAPEYAETGRITRKADVFSFGVVLMELITGLRTVDEERGEERQYLVAWFWSIKANKEKLMAAIDSSLDIDITKEEDSFDSISIISELAARCTAREPRQRPDMSHAVNVLASLIEKWNPLHHHTEEYCGIDYTLPLNQMVRDWQHSEEKTLSRNLEDSKGSLPAGFADSFISADAR